MSGSVNKVILVGNLGRDPEVRYSKDGAKIVNFSLATSDSWKDKQSGERREKTEWHRVVIFGEGLGDIAEKYLRKGTKVYLEGTLQTRKWTGDDGIERSTTEVVVPRFNGVMTMLGGRAEGGGGYEPAGRSADPDMTKLGGRAEGEGGYEPAVPSADPAPAFDGPDASRDQARDLDDDIPF